MSKLYKWLRRLFGFCPYCQCRLKKGMGGSSLFIPSSMLICPNKCYAEELHYTGATIVWDNGGKPLGIKEYDYAEKERI
ncbi:TPA: hypothetical protein ACORDH_002807 [Bacillus cereus]